MANNEINISPEQMLVAIHQHLRARFFDASKTLSKQAFNDLNDGKKMPLVEISSPDLGDVIGILSLDSSDFVGKLNYSAFRDALGSHLNRCAEKLKNEEGLNIFSNEETGAMLFNVPGLVQIDDQLNVIVTGIEQSKPGEIDIKLMFLHPDNFTSKN